MSSPLVRSVLYIPALNAKALAKAQHLPTDSLIIDLEDAIPASQKAEARQQLCTWLSQPHLPLKTIIVRINAVGSSWYEDDIRAIEGLPLDAILLPKIRHPDEIIHAQNDLASFLTRKDGCTLWVMAETPEILLHASLFASVYRSGAFSSLAAWVLGSNDLMKETGAQLSPCRETMNHWLATIILLARSTNSFAIDGVFNNLEDDAGFAAECIQGRNFGFDGKTVIHPSQLEAANMFFSPTAPQIAEARALVEAFALPENTEKGVIAFNGKMAERLHLHMAEKILKQADTIQRQGF